MATKAKEVKNLTPAEIEELKAQMATEITFDRRYKQGKTTNWQKNENMYYAVKSPTVESRANVELGKMQEFVHTLLSKIDNPLVFKFLKRKEAQLKRVANLNALRTVDQQNNDWDIKDLVGKKQGIIYGRAVFAYYADSIDGTYQSHLDNTDVYDFLIDPSAGGIDIEKAMHLGRYGVVKTRKQLEALAKSQTSKHIKSEIKSLLDGTGNNTEKPQEEVNKDKRRQAQNTIGEKNLQNDDQFKFWEWFTTYKGVRYYALYQETGGKCIKIERLTDMFTPNKQFPMGAYPFWTWAAFPDLTEFWSPSYCDYVREVFQAQNVSINQSLDNSEQINKPQKVVNVTAIENLAELKYKKNGTIKVKGDFDANKAVQILETPAINTPINVYNVLENIQEKASGVTAGSKGVAEEDGKVGIYKGNQEATADRFGLLNKSYSFGYKRFARLYEIGVRDHLNKKTSIDIIGPNGIETMDITRTDIFKNKDEFGVLVEASNAETMASTIKQDQKTAFLSSQVNNQTINQQKLFEIQAKNAGLNEEEVKELMDISEFGNQELMAEAERDIEGLLDGDNVKVNMSATNAYKQRFVDYLKDHEEDMSMKQFTSIIDYVAKVDKYIYKNTARMINKSMIDTLNQGSLPVSGAGEQPNNQKIPQQNNGQVQNQG